MNPARDDEEQEEWRKETAQIKMKSAEEFHAPNWMPITIADLIFDKFLLSWLGNNDLLSNLQPPPIDLRVCLHHLLLADVNFLGAEISDYSA